MKTEALYALYKPLLFSLAYCMLGSVSDAEDMVQETFLTLEEQSSQKIQNMKSYLCKTVTNRCIDRLRSAQKRREVYTGEWLPEPLISEINENEEPLHRYLQKESISTAYLLLLEQLSATERAVFLLRASLGYSYDEIAEIVGKTPTHCRQIFRRARQSLGDSGESSSVPAQAGQLVEQFAQALSTGNVPQLLNLLGPDAVLISDGGGKVRAATRPILGPQRIRAFFSGILSKTPPGLSWKICDVNGLPGMVIHMDHHVIGVFSFHFESEKIGGIYWQVNPDKLRHLL
ncbi:RNA polymerase sigma-70 factor [Melghirimyces algeriensis]|uniref:RNA polymerase sigma-70 factor, ECF subfamily n=1 Tax=Melghirimyces algeriensis TaxID=910412 RepID=A0A521D820_9BACL|nr:RNA polymerase sigma-70 factor [Melghirimyces algeriensis]SMO67856.1 RNA polymerase sigma-70 factor, ECF subfamily [Melghirimyces algeriensis]